MNKIVVRHEIYKCHTSVAGMPVAKSARKWFVTESPEVESKTFIDQLLEEQRLLTAVSRFAQKHETADFPLQSRYYRDLLPLSAPRGGEQYAFEVDLDRCSGCKACVAACHSLNGLEPGESWRSVGLLISDEPVAPFQQTITTACHHCVDPACLNGCPVLAYEKDAHTGIVRHLDDQCIGCQYCVLKCPYEVPRYSSRLGIVRKCDMCTNRLAVGEAPACVQSCPSAAIRITVVDKETVRERHTITTSSENTFLVESPDPAYTIPTTRYVSAKGVPAELRAADSEAIRPAAPHWPLVLMLVLTAAGIGSFWFDTLAVFSGRPTGPAQKLFSAALVFAGMGVSIFHLGRPLQAWRAFTGVRRSWLSREILAFNVLSLSVLLLLAGALPFAFSASYLPAVLVFCSLTGAAALACSMMVYIDTPRDFWRWSQTVPRFLGTSILLGAAVSTIFGAGLFAVIGVIAVMKLALEATLFRHLSNPGNTALKRSARLLVGDLGKVSAFRFASLAAAAAMASLAAVRIIPANVASAIFIFALMLPSEIAERYLFFRAVAQPKMPGGPV